MKRTDYISWDQYFMGIAMMSAERSKDPSTQVGACIVDKNNRILSMGYNGMPAGCDDDTMPWGKSGAPLDNKYFYVHLHQGVAGSHGQAQGLGLALLLGGAPDGVGEGLDEQGDQEEDIGLGDGHFPHERGQAIADKDRLSVVEQHQYTGVQAEGVGETGRFQ